MLITVWGQQVTIFEQIGDYLSGHWFGLEQTVKSRKLAHLLRLLRKEKNDGCKRDIGMIRRWKKVRVKEGNDGPLIVSAIIVGHRVKRVYVDNDSAIEVSNTKRYSHAGYGI
ncbi:hypothetical protein L1987_57482 [Smallanthus sonchifolius]|uniref:Uncharacterized protein n=1 Tax=Smallanthus sonchifolius TaxID=185202 RepID=A0ACB9DDM4_9ASTR|nr:hypothetical protein L1987_57482 [Smallanthus sonchifolius]